MKRETTGFKSLVTFGSCKNYKQQCMLSYLQESNVLFRLQELRKKCRHPCKKAMESRLSRGVTKTGERVIYFDCVQHEEANSRNVHVEIHSVQVMKTSLKLYKDQRKILELTGNFYQADEKKGKHRRNRMQEYKDKWSLFQDSESEKKCS
uniref:Uncharacterized protein n=1 Tax=Amazona collaria TaxID=241587 RepID=A0A8B9IWB5_9PSIT